MDVLEKKSLLCYFFRRVLCSVAVSIPNFLYVAETDILIAHVTLVFLFKMTLVLPPTTANFIGPFNTRYMFRQY